eukprot:882852-Amphidinium_carterae.1
MLGIARTGALINKTAVEEVAGPSLHDYASERPRTPLGEFCPDLAPEVRSTCGSTSIAVLIFVHVELLFIGTLATQAVRSAEANK